ncbi:non-ribosomal peptide synthetase, partial [Marinibactrum halimedae]
QVKTTCLEAYEHQDTPFEKIVEALPLQRNLGVNPLFQIMFVLQNNRSERLIFDDADTKISPYPLENTVSKFDLTLSLAETDSGLQGSLTYRTSLYKVSTIERLAGHFMALCQSVVTAPTKALSAFQFMGEAERQLTLAQYNQAQYNQAQYNQTSLDCPRNQCLHERFEEQVNATPDAIAVVAQGEALSFQQLYERSQRLARYLQSVGVKPDTLVGLCVERSLDMMVGILGILQAGGAYVPLDPSYPEDRLAYMLEDSQACLVITQARYQSKLSALAQADRPLLVLDTQQADIDACADLSLTRAVSATHLAYVIYTSGSTGKPKGVMVEHRSIVNHMQWIIHQLALGVGKSVLQKTAFNFDAAQWELMALLGGSTVVMAAPGIEKDPQQLHDAIVTHQITTLQCVPVLLNALLEQTELHRCDSLEAILCGGELLEQRLVERCQQALPAASLYNLYGPTECTIDATFYDCSAQPAATSSAGVITPIGIPVNNTQVYVL